MEFVAGKNTFHYGLMDVKLFQIKITLFEGLSIVSTAKTLWSASRYELTLGLYYFSFVCLDCVFRLVFFIFLLPLLK